MIKNEINCTHCGADIAQMPGIVLKRCPVCNKVNFLHDKGRK